MRISYYTFKRANICIKFGSKKITALYPAVQKESSMLPTFYEILWYFFLYSFMGWVLEVSYSSLKQKHFVNCGFLNGPFCPIYGISLSLASVLFYELQNQIFWLFLGCAILTTLLEFISGKILEKIFHRKWWDYSQLPHNADGYICLRYSVMWGIGSVVILKFVQPFLDFLLGLIPSLPGHIILLVLIILLAVDMLGTCAGILQWQKESKTVSDINQNLTGLSNKIGHFLYQHLEKRLLRGKAPSGPASVLFTKKPKDASLPFAHGCGFYKLFWLFMIGAFLGDITETIFCLITSGKLMSRSSVIYGPFSIVWGLGIFLFTALLYRFREKEDRYLFVAGTFLGGLYEYICSVFTELVFGTIFWDYSKIPFNLGGRINLLYCFFWGIAAIVWFKYLYPVFSRWIEKIPVRAGKILTWICLVFMIFNVSISGLALARYSERNAGAPPSNSLEQFIDEHYPDERMERIYPNAKITG